MAQVKFYLTCAATIFRQISTQDTPSKMEGFILRHNIMPFGHLSALLPSTTLGVCDKVYNYAEVPKSIAEEIVSKVRGV